MPAAPPPAASPSLDVLLQEIRALKRGQDQILALLKAGAGAGAEAPSASAASSFPAADDDFPEPPPPPPMRTRRRKTVLLVDDDAETRQAAVEALQGAEVPVETSSDGNAAIAAIAANRPDVIVLELAMGGAMAGKDVINMIKATMEWLDIPIVLYTRAPISGPQEARTVHGADDYVVKGPSGPQHLVTRVISMFRSRG
jgi:CheY-like chemotaxis protein